MSVLKTASIIFLAVSLLTGACSQDESAAPPPPANPKPVAAPAVLEVDVQAKAKAFLDKYYEDFGKAELAQTTAQWTAENTGKKEDFDAYAAADLAVKTLHSDKARYEELKKLLEAKDKLDPLTRRSLEVANLAFKGNQLPKEILEKMVTESTAIEQIFNTYRADLGGKKLSNNDLLELLAKERRTEKRKAIWEALKQVGAEVAPRLTALAKTRNEAAKLLGYADFWDMQVRLQEHDPGLLVAIFADLERVTNAPFKAMKEELDKELAARFKVKAEDMMPWHYDNPFFQAAPPSSKVDLDDFYKGKDKEEIVRIAKRFYDDIGLPLGDVLDRSDFFEREGKNQHAFCTAIDRKGDVRMLLNIKPTCDWMETMLHESGHAVYAKNLDFSLPFNLRDSAHIFTTEGVAMLFGALGKNPVWMVEYAGASPSKVKDAEGALLEQRRREQLIFTRWTLVMFNFEKDMYANPDQDLNKLWYDDVERFQLLKRPPERNAPDWAAKPHFTIAPVYYHNYMLGELFAAQLRATIAKVVKHDGPLWTLSYSGRKSIGDYLRKKVFEPGMAKPWPEFVTDATGQPLSPAAYAQELR
ncbi:MAG: M2 family metallopeptidase [Deltaproteobacteria bacterium]|nr:M2 family metallopeptidase [Deltaproteobacteria bacterium]